MISAAEGRRFTLKGSQADRRTSPRRALAYRRSPPTLSAENMGGRWRMAPTKPCRARSRSSSAAPRAALVGGPGRLIVCSRSARNHACSLAASQSAASPLPQRELRRPGWAPATQPACTGCSICACSVADAFLHSSTPHEIACGLQCRISDRGLRWLCAPPAPVICSHGSSSHGSTSASYVAVAWPSRSVPAHGAVLRRRVEHRATWYEQLQRCFWPMAHPV
jgi:hypothetical protein